MNSVWFNWKDNLMNKVLYNLQKCLIIDLDTNYLQLFNLKTQNKIIKIK
jgi:hypothetical protein